MLEILLKQKIDHLATARNNLIIAVHRKDNDKIMEYGQDEEYYQEQVDNLTMAYNAKQNAIKCYPLNKRI